MNLNISYYLHQHLLTQCYPQLFLSILDNICLTNLKTNNCTSVTIDCKVVHICEFSEHSIKTLG